MLKSVHIKNNIREIGHYVFSDIYKILFDKNFNESSEKELYDNFLLVCEVLFEYNDITFEVEKFKTLNVFDVDVYVDKSFIFGYRCGSDWKEQIYIKSIPLIKKTFGLDYWVKSRNISSRKQEILRNRSLEYILD